MANDRGLVLSKKGNYDPWGWNAAGTPRIGFTGEYQGGGLVYLRARWYNPTTGTLLGRDPFAGNTRQPYSQHPFQYGYSNPVSNVDPSGRVVCQRSFDQGCIYEERLEAEYGIKITYPNSGSRSSEDPFEKCFTFSNGGPQDSDCSFSAAFYWFVDAPDLGDLRKILLETLHTIDRKTNNAVTLNYRNFTTTFRRDQGPYIGLWDNTVRTIFLYDRALTYAGLGRSALEWTITHEVGHSIDDGFSSRMEQEIEIIAATCQDVELGPTWYNDDNKQNIASFSVSEDFADSFALYVWGTQHPFFMKRQANQSDTLIGDGRPGIPFRMRFINSLGF